MRWRRVLSLFLCVILLVSVCVSSSSIAAVADEENDRSFSTMASAAASAFAAAIYEKDATVSFGDAAGHVGNYGAVMGYSADNGEGGLLGWLQTKTSFAEASVSYDSIANLGKSKSGDGNPLDWWQAILGLAGSALGGASEVKPAETRSGVWAYCQYGYMLSDLGLDKTGQGGVHFIRLITGWGMLAMYTMSMAVPVLFGFVINVLKTLNPFQFFVDTNFRDFLGQNASMGGVDTVGDIPEALQGLASTVADWYNAFQSFSEAVIIPLFFVMLVLTLLLSKQQNKGSKIKKYVLRLFIIFLCIPICGATYTSVLDNMSDSAQLGYAQAGMIVKSTFVDFEKWAKVGRLGTPPGVTFSADNLIDDSTEANGAAASTSGRIRSIAYSINGLSETDSGGLGTVATPEGMGSGRTGSMTWNKAVSTAGAVVAAGTHGVSVGSEQFGEIKEIFDLLVRYANGEFYTASMFESDAKSAIDNSDVSTEDKNKLFDASNKASGFQESGSKNFALGEDHFPADTYSDVPAFNIWGNGGLNYEVSASGKTGEFTSKGQKGLSTMSMYNYLNSQFGRNSVTMYSTDSSSDFVRKSHFSVNLIGNGLMSALYWFNALLMLASLSVVGIFYAFGMLIGVVKRSLKFISSVPFALLGSIKAGARIITYVVMMIVEIIGTLFVYSLVSQILLSFSTIVEGGLYKALLGVGFAAAFLPAFNILMQILSIILLIWLLVMALRLRKSFCKSVDEAASAIIDKFFDTNAMPAPAAPKQSPFKAGLAQGAGAAAGARAMNRIGNGGSGAPGTKTNGQSTKTVSNGGGPNGGGGWDDSGPAGSMDVNGTTTTEFTSDGTATEGGFEGHTFADSGRVAGLLGDGSGGGSGGFDGPGGPPTGGGSTIDMSGAPDAAVGGGGAGGAMSKASDVAFAENNSRVENQQGANVLSGETLEKHKQDVENEEKVRMAKATGTMSAMDEERMDENVAQAKKDAAKQAAKDVAQVAVGAGEVAYAATTGDVSAVKDGVKNIDHGVKGLQMDAKAGSDEQKRQNAEAVQRMDSERHTSSEHTSSSSSEHKSSSDGAKKVLGQRQPNNPQTLQNSQSGNDHMSAGQTMNIVGGSSDKPGSEKSGGQYHQGGQSHGGGAGRRPDQKNVRPQSTTINNNGPVTSTSRNSQNSNTSNTSQYSDRSMGQYNGVDNSRVNVDESQDNRINAESKRVNPVKDTPKPSQQQQNRPQAQPQKPENGKSISTEKKPVVNNTPKSPQVTRQKKKVIKRVQTPAQQKYMRERKPKNVEPKE